MNFKTHYNFDFSEASNFEEVDPVSVTVPGQSLTIKELLTNYVRGINVDAISKNPIYHESDDPNFDDSDFSRDPMYDLSDITDRLQASKPVDLVLPKKEEQEPVQEVPSNETVK